MKHPALTRVFALIVAVLSLVMLLAGIMGIGKAISDRDESVRSYDVLQGRVDTYEELSEKLNGSPSYKDAMKQLEKDEEEHRKNANSQKDSLMEYTAAEAMMKEAREMLDMVDALLDQATPLLLGMVNSLADNLPEMYNDAVDEIAEEYADQAGDIVSELIRTISERDDFKDAIENEEITPGTISGIIREEVEKLADQNFKYDESTVYEEADVSPYFDEVDFDELNSEMHTLMQVGDILVNYIEQYTEGKKELNKNEMENLKKGIEIAVQKYELMKESEELAELKAANEQLKEDENKLKSTKVHILKNENIKAATDNGEDIVKAAKDELKLEKENYKKDFAFRLDANILMIIGGIAGILGIPGAYEIKKTRPWLIVPVAMCALFAAAADGISMHLGRGQMYSALAVLIFGIIQLIIILPKEKMKEVV